MRKGLDVLITTISESVVIEVFDNLSTHGKSAYDIALDNGFVGSESEWLYSQVGDSAYTVSLNDGFVGTKSEWLKSLVGKSAYDIALDYGFVGTESEWINSLASKDLLDTKLNKDDFLLTLQDNINNPALVIDQGSF